MTASLSTTMTAIANVVSGLSGLKQTFAWPPEDIEPPCCWVEIDDGEIVTFKSGVLDVPFSIYLLTSKQVDRAGYQKALAYLDAEGSTSVMAAINGANTITNGQNTFNGVSSVYVSCLGWQFLDDQTRAAVDAFGVRFGGRAVITKE